MAQPVQLLYGNAQPAVRHPSVVPRITGNLLESLPSDIFGDTHLAVQLQDSRHQAQSDKQIEGTALLFQDRLEGGPLPRLLVIHMFIQQPIAVPSQHNQSRLLSNAGCSVQE